jgi:hypothetical protein
MKISPLFKRHSGQSPQLTVFQRGQSRLLTVPHSKTSPTSHGASRSARQRPGVRLWAKPSTAFACRTVVHSAHHLHTRSKSGESAPLHPAPYTEVSRAAPGVEAPARGDFEKATQAGSDTLGAAPAVMLSIPEQDPIAPFPPPHLYP